MREASRIKPDMPPHSTGDASVSPVPLRPEDPQYAGCATAKAQDELAMLGLDRGPRRPNLSEIRAEGNCEGACPTATEQRQHKAHRGISVSLDKDLWCPTSGLILQFACG